MKRRLARLFLVLVGITAGTLLCEGFLRVFAPQIFPPHPPGMYTLDPEVGYVPTPGFEGCLKKPEFEACFTTSPGGLRGSDPPPRGPETRRILVLGDSMAWGYGVSDEEAFPRQLELLLGDRFPDRDIQVSNAAVPGYGTAEQLAWLRKFGADLAPDVVVLQFFSVNDFEDNRVPARLWATLHEGILASRFDFMDAHGWPWHLRATTWLKNRSHFARLLSDRSGYLAMRWGLTDLAGDLWQDGEDFSPRDAERARDYLLGIAETATELEASVLFLYTTGQEMVHSPEPRELRSADLVESTAELAGVPWLDVTTALRDHEERENLFFPQDGHWSPAGHRVVAETVMDELIALRSLEIGKTP